MKGKNEEARVDLGISLLCFQSPGQRGRAWAAELGELDVDPVSRSTEAQAVQLLSFCRTGCRAAQVDTAEKSVACVRSPGASTSDGREVRWPCSQRYQ